MNCCKVFILLLLTLSAVFAYKPKHRHLRRDRAKIQGRIMPVDEPPPGVEDPPPSTPPTDSTPPPTTDSSSTPPTNPSTDPTSPPPTNPSPPPTGPHPPPTKRNDSDLGGYEKWVDQTPSGSIYYINKNTPGDRNGAIGSCSALGSKLSGKHVTPLIIDGDTELSGLIASLDLLPAGTCVWTAATYVQKADGKTWRLIIPGKNSSRTLDDGDATAGNQTTGRRKRSTEVEQVVSPTGEFFSLVRETIYPFINNLDSIYPCSPPQKEFVQTHCKPIECKVETKQCTMGNKTRTCTLKSNGTCSVVPTGDCSASCNNCTISQPTCYVSQKECLVESGRKCFADPGKCSIETPPCVVDRPKCITIPQPCNISLPNDKNLCTPPDCLFYSKECEAKKKTVNGKIVFDDSCQIPDICLKPMVCLGPTLYCPPPETFCPPETVKCPPPKIVCDKPSIGCDDPVIHCPPPSIMCTQPVVNCDAPVVKCPSVVSTCTNPEYECTTPEVKCDPPEVSCSKPEPCKMAPPPEKPDCFIKPCEAGCECVRILKNPTTNKWETQQCQCSEQCLYVCETK